MPIKIFTHTVQLKNDPAAISGLQELLDQSSTDHFFQSPEFFEFIEPVKGYQPILLILKGESGAVEGSLMGAFQRDGGSIKSWLSRRLIVWGGPIVSEHASVDKKKAVQTLLHALKKEAGGKAIYIEFRNYFDTTDLQEAFQSSGFTYKPHLNYLVALDEEDDVQKRMSSNRRRQIRSSLSAGAVIEEPKTEEEVRALYDLLEDLYKTKVKKPLPSFELFRSFWTSPNGKVFVVKHGDKVMGGSAGPVYRDKIIYQWYVCGDNGAVKGVHSSVLATWAQIDYGLKHGYQLFDFMGAGRPEEAYGVREFKARFGGEEVSYGRYEKILNPALYRIGKLGLQIYHKLK
ncbi:MAG: GNAT family N-acetyltransferase [Saprospirales bacterium]|nr:GNAT family N-acetyltransferase [Saprospirales bacterium]